MNAPMLTYTSIFMRYSGRLPSKSVFFALIAWLIFTALPAPAFARAHVKSKDKAHTGTFLIQHTDSEEQDKPAHILYFLQEDNGTLAQLRGNPLGLISGTRVVAVGHLRGGWFIQAKKRGWMKKARGRKDIATVKSGGFTGEKKTLSILVNFQNDAVQPFTPATVATQMYTGATSVRSALLEMSRNRLTLTGVTTATGDVAGWFTLPINATCTISTIQNAALTAATGNGYNMASYDKVIFVYPNVGCSYSGMGQVPGKFAWVTGNTFSRYVVTHEIGHTYGLNHASAYNCTNGGVAVAFSASCTRDEYGDEYDTMGTPTGTSATWMFHFNGFEKAFLGWMDPQNIQTITTDGSYTIAPSDIDSNAVQMLKVPASYDASGNPTKWWYVECRTPGIFDDFGPSAPVVTGASIRTAPNYAITSDRSHIIDTTPGTASMADAALAVGSTFSDGADVSLTTTAADAGGVTVQVTRLGDVTAPTTPTDLRLVSSTKTTLSFAWGQSTDNVAIGKYMIYRDGVQVNMTGSTAITVPSSSGDWTYTVAAQDKHGNVSAQSTGVAVSVDNSAPTVPGGFQITAKTKDGVQLDWNASTDNSGVDPSYAIMRSGTKIATVTETTFTDTSITISGTYTYSVAAIDSSLNQSAATVGVGVWADVVIPSQPLDLRITGKTSTSLSLAWGASRDNIGVTGYVISLNGVEYQTVAGLSAPVFDLTEGQTYSVSVWAVDAWLNRSIASTIQLTLDVTAPTEPRSLHRGKVSKASVVLLWSAASDNVRVTRYAVFRGKKFIGYTRGRSFLARRLAPGMRYRFSVKALDAAGHVSRSSNVLSVRTRR